jgi:hypothetical protein
VLSRLLCCLCCAVPCSFVALPHLQIFKMDFSDLFSKTPKLTAWSAVLAYSLVMIFDIGAAGHMLCCGTPCNRVVFAGNVQGQRAGHGY